MMAFAQDVKKVAILETVDKAGDVPYGVKLQVRMNLTYAISNTPGYDGYDRVDMASIMGEQNFQRTGMVSDAQIKKLGEMTGAQYVLIAEAALYDAQNIIITAKVLDVETGGVTSVFYIYLLKENFAQVPDELYYAAKVDGTSDLKYLFKVMIPICRPTIITVTILKVIECWNSYVWPRLITDDQAYFLVSNGIQEIRENGFGRENIPAMMAAVVVISAPLIVLFLVFRRKIMAGVARGGTKG